MSIWDSRGEQPPCCDAHARNEKVWLNIKAIKKTRIIIAIVQGKSATRRSKSSFYSSFVLFFDLIFFTCQQPLEDSASQFGAVSSHIFPVHNFKGCKDAFSNIPETKGRPTVRVPEASSPSFGMRPSSIRETWPNHRSPRLFKISWNMNCVHWRITSSCCALQLGLEKWRSQTSLYFAHTQYPRLCG